MQPPTPATAVIPDYASWLNTEAVASKLGVSYAQANAWIVQGIRTEKGRIHLKAVKIGGRWRVNPEWVTAFVNAMTVASLPKSAISPEFVAELPAPPGKGFTESEREQRVEAARARMRARGHLTPN